MSQAKKLPKEDADPMPHSADAASVQELKVTAHMMSLPSGLFCFVNEGVNVRQDGMPGVRISPPPSGAHNVEISGFRPDGWLNADGDAALVRVPKGPAHVLVTIYQLPNMPDGAPKLQVRQLLGAADMPASGADLLARSEMLAHIQSRGDVGAALGTWLGERGSNLWIEGFALNAPKGIDPKDLSYQALLGRGWFSPWAEAGEYCGSRGMALPLLGLRVRLSGAAAEQYELRCNASFVGGATAGPVGNDETSEDAALAPLEAFQLTLTPKLRRGGKTKR
jgi:Clostridial hydrophobic W